MEVDLPEGKKKGTFNCFSSDFTGVDTRLYIHKSKLVNSPPLSNREVVLLLIPYSLFVNAE